MIPLQRIYIPDSLLEVGDKVTVKKIFDAAENYWIHRLSTVTKGLNSKYESHPRKNQKKRRKSKAKYIEQRKRLRNNDNDSININDNTDTNTPPPKLFYNPTSDIFQTTPRSSRRFIHHDPEAGAKALAEYTFGKPRFDSATAHLKSMHLARLEAINRWIIEQGENQTDDQRLVAMLIQQYIKNSYIHIPKQLTVTHHIVSPFFHVDIDRKNLESIFYDLAEKYFREKYVHSGPRKYSSNMEAR